MCKMLGITRSLIYYHLDKEKEQEQKPLEQEEQIEKEIKEIFRKSKNNYGTRKIKVELENKGYQVSRRKISRIMRENKLVSNYAVKEYKVEKTVSNESKIENKIDLSLIHI